MYYGKIIFGLCVGLSGLLAADQTLAAPKIQNWQTGNGARVYFVEANELPMVDVQIWFDAGAARDQGKNGLALLTNAVMPEGAADLNADDLAEKFEAIGAQTGNSSERDVAEFTLRTLAEPRYLNSAAALVASILSQPTFPEDAFNREKNRLLVALKSRKQSPDDIAEEEFFQMLYGTHPYATVPEGNEETVRNLSRDDLLGFYKKYYVARNCVIAIVGNVNTANAKKLAETLVGKLPAGEAAPLIADQTATVSVGSQFIEHPSTQSHILVGQPGLKRNDPDYFALYLGNHILGGNGLVSRISDEIREKRGLSYSAYSYFLPMRQTGPYILGLQTANNSRDEALKVLQQTLRDFIADGPTAAEVDAAKKNLTGGFPLRVSSNNKIVEYVAMIGFYNLPLDYLDKFNDKIQAITLEQIKDAFKRRVNPDKMAVVVVGAKG